MSCSSQKAQAGSLRAYSDMWNSRSIRPRHNFRISLDMGVSKNRGVSPQIIHLFIGFSIINHPFWGTPIFGNTQIIKSIHVFCDVNIRHSMPLETSHDAKAQAAQPSQLESLQGWWAHQQKSTASWSPYHVSTMSQISLEKSTESTMYDMI